MERKNVLLVGDWYTYFEIPHRVQHLQRLAHRNEFTRVVEIHERSAELCSLSSAFSLSLSIPNGTYFE
jgi:hypothetical protein